MGKKFLVTCTVLLAAVTVSEAGFILYRSRIQQLPSVGQQPDRKVSAAIPTSILTSPAPLPLSYPEKFDVSPAKVGANTAWQDGMFLYRASSSADKRTAVSPYAVTGVVRDAAGREFTISPVSPAQTTVSPGTPVRLRLTEKYGEAAILRRSNGKVLSEKIPFTDIKPGDAVEAYSLTNLGENYYATTQIFVVK